MKKITGRNRIVLVFLLILFITYLITSYVLLQPIKELRFTQTDSDLQLSPVDVKAITENISATDPNALQHKIETFTQNGLSGWITELAILSDDGIVARGNPLQLRSEQRARIHLMILNGWKLSHELDTIILIDFKQLTFRASEQVNSVIHFTEIGVGERRMVEFDLPPLPNGVHHLSLLLIADPQSQSRDPAYRMTQQRSFSEERFELIIGSDSLLTPYPTFKNQQIAMAASDILAFVQVPDSVNSRRPLVEDRMERGTTKSFYIQLIRAGGNKVSSAFTGDLEFKIATFWNDKLYGTLDYKLDHDFPDWKTVPVVMQAPRESGTYQLSFVAFDFPNYLMFSEQGKRLLFTGVPYFTQRILVDVR